MNKQKKRETARGAEVTECCDLYHVALWVGAHATNRDTITLTD